MKLTPYIIKFFAYFILIAGYCDLYPNVPNTKFQAIVFDCDGVLVDTEYLKFLAWEEALKTEKTPFSIEDYVPLVGHSSKNILQMIQKNKNISISEEVIKIKNNKYKSLQKQGVPSIPEMVNFVLRLLEFKNQLGIKLALASSAPKEEILANLKQVGLEKAFDVILSGSDDLKAYKDPEGTNKPKPYIYIESAKQLGISPEYCLVFEDTKAGVDAAAAAGMVVVAVPNQFTLTHDFSNADYIISSYKELASFEVLNRINKKQ